MNSIILSGRLTNDPELRYTASDIAVAHFTLAVDRRFKRDETDFIPVTAWRKTAEFVDRYFRKGQKVIVSGSLQTNTYTDNNGNNRKSFEVVAEQVEFADSKRTDSGQPQQATQQAQAPQDSAPPAYAENQDDGFEQISYNDGDLPF